MSHAPGLADWHVLGIEPTADIEAIRRAYRIRVKATGPENDPEGFQALRQAYEIILAQVQNVQDGQNGNKAVTALADLPSAAQAFLTQLAALRAAGDKAGALAFVQATLAAQPPGSSALDAMEDALFDEVALQKQLSPELFLLLAGHFDWRDIQGRAARADPERHAAVLDRIGAEDWLLDLRQAAKTPGGQVAALLLAPHANALALLMNAGLDAAGRAQVRTRFDDLLTHAVFVLTRFDGATLALLREAVEGPPLLGEASTPAPAAAVKAPVAAPSAALSQTKKWQVWLIAGLALVAVTSAQIWWKTSGRDGRNRPQGIDTSLALNIAEPLVRKADTAWLETREEPGGIFVDWAPVMHMRRAIADVRFGVNVTEPNTALTLPTVDVPIGFLAPRSIEYITMRIRYKDGTWSEVRHYSVWEGRQ